MDIIVIIGLPGSGKTTSIDKQYRNCCDYVIFDDMKRHAIEDKRDFVYSRYYPEIVNIIKNESMNIVISDIDFCNLNKLQEAVDILKFWLKESKSNYNIKGKIFRNNLEQCKKNLQKDNSNNMKDKLRKAKKYSTTYEPEKIKDKLDEAQINEVYSGC